MNLKTWLVFLRALAYVLVPKWRFFDRPGDQILLQIRFAALLESGQEVTFSNWKPALGRHPRRWKGLGRELFLNAEGNLKLRIQSLSEQLSLEISSLNFDDPSSTQVTETSRCYQLLKILSKWLVRSDPDKSVKAYSHYQFRIAIRQPVGSEREIVVSELSEFTGDDMKTQEIR